MPFRRPYPVVGIVADLVQLILDLPAQSTGTHQTPAGTVVTTDWAKVFGLRLQLCFDLGRAFGTPGNKMCSHRSSDRCRIRGSGQMPWPRSVIDQQIDTRGGKIDFGPAVGLAIKTFGDVNCGNGNDVRV